MMLTIRFALSICASSVIAACAQPIQPNPPPMLPSVSLQELMQDVVDPSADGIWDAVETTVTSAGESTRQPQTAEEWLAVRRAAITLSEAGNLLMMTGRRVGAHEFPAEAKGALDSTQIEHRIASQRSAFNGFAAALRAAALTTLSAADARDPVRLVSAGGTIDQICEGCHLQFWYPNQVIPSLPKLSEVRSGLATQSALATLKQP